MTWSITFGTLYGSIFIKNASIPSTNATPNCTPMIILVVETFIATLNATFVFLGGGGGGGTLPKLNVTVVLNRTFNFLRGVTLPNQSVTVTLIPTNFLAPSSSLTDVILWVGGGGIFYHK